MKSRDSKDRSSIRGDVLCKGWIELVRGVITNLCCVRVREDEVQNDVAVWQLQQHSRPEKKTPRIKINSVRL